MAYPMPWCRRYVDDEVDLVQSLAILRHVGRKHGLSGSTHAQQAAVEEVRRMGAPVPDKMLSDAGQAVAS